MRFFSAFCPPYTGGLPIKASLRRALFVCSLSLGFVASGRAQDLRAHRWEDRVLLLYTETTQAPAYKKQIGALLKDREGLRERRLVVYTLLKDRFAIDLPPYEWREGHPAGLPAREGENGFGLVLIGLDGGVKRESQGFVPLEDLWAQIDGMPMRRAEIRNKGK